MKTFTYLAGGLSFSGSFYSCLYWAKKRTEQVPHIAVTIVKYQAGEKQGFVIAEATHEGLRFIERGRAVKKPKRAAR